MTDASLPLNGPSQDLNAITVDLYRYARTFGRLSTAQAKKRLEKNQQINAQRREARKPSDDFRLDDRVDIESYKKGVEHTHK